MKTKMRTKNRLEKETEENNNEKRYKKRNRKKIKTVLHHLFIVNSQYHIAKKLSLYLMAYFQKESCGIMR